MPPKAPKKNGYMLFAESRKDALLAEGHTINGLRDLLELCSSDWEKLTDEEKSKFAERAKELNARKKEQDGQKAGSSPPKTSKGAAPDALVGACKNLSLQRDPYMFSAEDTMIYKANQAIVNDMFENNPDWMNQPIVICCFTSYVEPDHDLTYLPAEIGLTAMSLTRGVIDNYARIIDPSPIPKGHGIEAIQTAEKYGLPKFGTVPEFAKFDSIMTILSDFLYTYKGKLPGEKKLGYVFCLESDYLFVTRCLEALFEMAGRSIPIKVLSLDLYGFLASSYGKKKAEERRGAPVVVDGRIKALNTNRKVGKSLTGSFIYSAAHPSCALGLFLSENEVDPVIKQIDNYKYFEELCCIYHVKNGQEIQNCALNMSNRFAFSLLEILTLSNQVEIIPGGHYPEIDKPEVEKNRRFNMLKKWGITSHEEKMETYKPEYVAEASFAGRRRFTRDDSCLERCRSTDEDFGNVQVFESGLPTSFHHNMGMGRAPAYENESADGSGGFRGRVRVTYREPADDRSTRPRGRDRFSAMYRNDSEDEGPRIPEGYRRRQRPNENDVTEGNAEPHPYAGSVPTLFTRRDKQGSN